MHHETHLCSCCGGYSTSTWDRHIVKFDIESAYRMVPVHPINMPLLGIKWKENIYQGIHWGGRGGAIAPPPLNSSFSCAIIIL